MQLKNKQSARESYLELTRKSSKSFLVDVRSNKEWCDSGIADFSSEPEKLILCEWRKSPSMELNNDFFTELTNKLDLTEVENLYFICAAGIRSEEAAHFTSSRLIDSGYKIRCINVFDGFSGNRNTFLSFRSITGWKPCGLPCRPFH